MTDEQLKELHEEGYRDWDRFLAHFPLETLDEISLDRYAKAGDQTTLVYWLEYELAKWGGIGGGSNFKTGIYSRKDLTEQTGGQTYLTYNDTHAWYTKYGNTAQEAFEKVRALVVQVAHAAREGDLEAIGAVDLGEKFKWKIASVYQKRDAPCMVNVFTKEVLAAFLDETLAGRSLAQLQPLVMERRQAGEGVLEFYTRLWSAWTRTVHGIAIWKLSHDPDKFTEEERESLMQQQLAVAGREFPDFMKVPTGTIFYLCHANSMQLLARFTSGPEDAERGPDYSQRHYELLAVAHRHDEFNISREAWTPRGSSIFKQVPKEKLPDFQRWLLQPYFAIDLAEMRELQPLSMRDTVLIQPPTMNLTFDAPLPERGPLNRVLYGPPGTGKTYRSVAEAIAIIDGGTVEELADISEYPVTKKRFDELRGSGQIEFITFHPSYAYQDFVEGIRPVTEEGQLRYEVEPGVLKRIAKKACDNWYESQKPIAAPLTDEERFERAYRLMIADIVESENGVIEATLSRGAIADVTTTAAGGGVTVQTKGSATAYPLSKARVQELWASRAGVTRPADIELPVATYFWAVLQVLLQADSRAEALAAIDGSSAAAVPINQPALRNFVLVIDEINRGNISKIFGELITLIEDDKRLGRPNELTARLPYSGPAEPFGLPPNLYLVGTMNTADRSIALMDTALRRRFSFVELMPDAKKVPLEPVGGVHLGKLLLALNSRIAFLFDREHTLGHAFFCNLETFENVVAALMGKVIPLLQEYFHEDWSRIQLVLDGPRFEKDLQLVFVEEEVDAATLFGSKNDGLEAQKTYRVRPEADVTLEMVKAIYE
jgi:5-methylcytosine-specific restriction protein B